MSTAIAWLGIVAGLWLANAVLDGLRFKGGFGDYLIVAAVFGVLNIVLGWLIFTVLAIASLGLALIFAFATQVVVYAIILQLTSSLSTRLKVNSFGTAVAAGFIISLAGTGADALTRILL